LERTGWLTSLLCGLVFVVAVSEALRLEVQVLDAYGVRAAAVGLNLVPVLFEGLREIRDVRPGSEARHVAFLGDSISISVHGGTGTVPRALRRELAETNGADAFEIHSLAALGTGPFDYYFLVDEIVSAEPDQVVIAFSLQSLGELFRSLSRERLSGWVAPSRLLEVALAPTHWIGLTADDLLMNVAIVNARGGEVWRQLLVEQARLGVAREQLAAWLGETLGGSGPQLFEMAAYSAQQRRARVDHERDRYRADAERRHYGAAFVGLEEDHPILVVLASTLETLSDAGIPTLVYVNPINVEHLGELGLLEDDRLSRSLTTIESVVRGAGSDYLDLHDLLPDAAFRDAAGHLGTAALPDAPRRVGAAVAQHLTARTGSR
jgi:hypothetical protein